MRVLTNRTSEVKKLYENKLQSKVKLGTQQWNRALWNHYKYTKKQFKFGV